MHMGRFEARSAWLERHFGPGHAFDDNDIYSTASEDCATVARVYPHAGMVLVQYRDGRADVMLPAWEGFGPEPHELPDTTYAH